MSEERVPYFQLDLDKLKSMPPDVSYFNKNVFANKL